MNPTAQASIKPRFRGYSHQWAFVAALGAGGMLVGAAPSARAASAAAVYAATLAAMYGISALYHRPMWSSRWRAFWRRLDHSMIFLLIAGTYTPFCLLGLDAQDGRRMLFLVWGGALAGIVLTVAWVKLPRWLTAALYVGLGWVAVTSLPEMRDQIGAAGLTLLVVGGALYTLGAVVYAVRRPDPIPRVFGYHEVFHVLVIAASICHFVAVARLVLQS